MYSSKRICDIVDMIAYDTLADIGADHCYIPILAIKRGKVKKALACDISPGPLKRAKENIVREKLEDKIELRLGDGLSPLRGEEGLKTLVIAGMGGLTITGILERGEALVKSFSQLILQPQSDLEAVRRYIHAASMKINDEKITFAGGVFYNIIDCGTGADTEYDKWDYALGRVLMEKRDGIFLEYLNCQIIKNREILKNIPQGNEHSVRIQELQEYIEKCGEILYGGKNK